MMFHIVYKITNLLNEMYYIGKHSTTTPYNMKDYWGSSDWLKSSIKIHGKENFKRETLFVFETEEEAYVKEEEIVTPKFVTRKDTYNFMIGGKGSPSGKNSPHWGKHRSEETKRKMSNNHCDCNGKNNSFYGKHHTEETRELQSKLKTGENNANWGKHFSEEARKKMSVLAVKRYNSPEGEKTKKKLQIAKGLTSEIINQRLSDIKNEPKTRGWKTRLAGKWGIGKSPTGKFIKKYASDLAVENPITKQRLKDIQNIEKVRGWKTRLSEKWGLELSTACGFIRSHAND